MDEASGVKPKKRGRPASGGRDPFVGVRLPAETLARIDATGPRSVFIREAVDRELKRREKTKP
jgi:hypothetical protein